MISKKSLVKFQEIHKKLFNIELSEQDALESANKCLRMVELIYQPMTKDDYKKLQERRKETGDI